VVLFGPEARRGDGMTGAASSSSSVMNSQSRTASSRWQRPARILSRNAKSSVSIARKNLSRTSVRATSSIKISAYARLGFGSPIAQVSSQVCVRETWRRECRSLIRGSGHQVSRRSDLIPCSTPQRGSASIADPRGAHAQVGGEPQRRRRPTILIDATEHVRLAPCLGGGVIPIATRNNERTKGMAA